MMRNNYHILPDELKLWQHLYNQSLTIDGKESTIQTDGTKQLVLLPIMTYTVISTMLQKLKYLPNDCFNCIAIGENSICGLRPLSQTSPSLMYKITEILRTIVDGVRKQHILSVTMIFYKKNDMNTIYDCYSIEFDYSIKLSNDESTTSIHMIAHMIHQIEYMFNWNDALANDVELSFILSTFDQFGNNENKVPSPFHFIKNDFEKVYLDYETNHSMGRLTTQDGKMCLKFLPTTHQLSGSSLHSDNLSAKEKFFAHKEKTFDFENKNRSKSSNKIAKTTIVKSPKLKKNSKKNTATLIDPTKNDQSHPSSSSTSMKTKKKTSFLSTVKSFITPSRTTAPITSSTPNISDVVLIRHTSTPKPGETASRITLRGNSEAPPLSAIYEVSISNMSSPTPSTITATDISTATTPMIATERRHTERTPTVRGQTTATRKQIASMKIRDDSDPSDDDENEQFKRLFSRQKAKKSKDTAVVPVRNGDSLIEVSPISAATANNELIFTPPTTRKRQTTDRVGDDDLAAEHSTPPKTPRTSRRNRGEDEPSAKSTLMDTSDFQANIDSPRLLRSITKKLQQKASAASLAKKNLLYEVEPIVSDQSNIQNMTKNQEEMDHVYVNLERSSIALHYSMEESD